MPKKIHTYFWQSDSPLIFNPLYGFQLSDLWQRGSFSNLIKRLNQFFSKYKINWNETTLQKSILLQFRTFFPLKILIWNKAIFIQVKPVKILLLSNYHSFAQKHIKDLSFPNYHPFEQNLLMVKSVKNHTWFSTLLTINYPPGVQIPQVDPQAVNRGVQNINV